MAFTPLVFSKSDGLGVYPKEPVVEDRYERGSLTGKRTESVTYVFEKDGSFQLPEMVIWWWDIGRKEMQKIVLPSLQAAVSGSPAPADDSALDETEKGTVPTGPRLLWASMLLLVVLAGFAWRVRSSLWTRWQAWKHDRSQTEEAYFRRLVYACRQNDARASYHRLLAWLNRQSSGAPPVSLRQFLVAAGSEKLTQQVEDLENRLFKTGDQRSKRTAWSGRELGHELARCRRRRKRKRLVRSSLRGDLAALNPG
jgi:hypothetical protein